MGTTSLTFPRRMRKDGYKFTNNKRFFDKLRAELQTLPKPYKAPNKNFYYNVACSFDIETTSFFVHNVTGRVITCEEWAILTEKEKLPWIKRAAHYIWMFGLDGLCIYGRSWDDFISLIDFISEELKLSSQQRLICFVHNLSFEMQFIKHLFKWDQVFATRPYEPLYALTSSGIEFRCSYRNTNKRLELIGEGLKKYPVKKMVGDLDYNLLRNERTKLTRAELKYCLNDIRVVMAYIQEQIETEGAVHRIPLTSTGYVRRDLKNACFKGDGSRKPKIQRFRYREGMKDLVLTPKVYRMLKDATQGGFTHGSALFMGEELSGVGSYDIASDYPAAMVAELFPMSHFKERKIKSREEFRLYLSKYCCLFTVRLRGVKPSQYIDDYIPRARCHTCIGAVVNNGRVHEAEELTITITEQDFFIMERMYTWETIEVKDFHTSMRGYLPKEIVSCVLKYFRGKTELKDVEGKDEEYMLSKQLLNSIFGCTITSIINPEIKLVDGKWVVDDNVDITSEINKYNSKSSRFLFLAWGCWVTAYGRRNILNAILDGAGEDFVYSDTDSIKLRNPEKHTRFFVVYNEHYREKIKRALKYHGFAPDAANPKNKKGEIKELGVFENEGIYDRFKCLGAKRYMFEKNGKRIITVAGLSKKKGADYLSRTYGEDVFKHFDNNLSVPALETGKLTHTYIEERMEGVLVDYQGNAAPYEELSAVHLAPCPFSMGIAPEYIAFCEAMRYRQGHIEWL